MPRRGCRSRRAGSPLEEMLLVYGFVTGGERFTTFELAVARGSELAEKWRTRLFFTDAGARARR